MPDYNDLTYSLAGIRRKNPYDAKRQWGYEMLKAGSDASPVQHPLQGAARLAQALVGGWMGGKADRDEEKASKDYESKLAVAMAEPDPRKRIAMLPPEIGARMSGQLAVEEAKQQQINAQRQQQAAAFGSMPPQGQGPQGIPQPGYTPMPGNTHQATLGGFESGNNPQAVNPVSGAGGEFQFMPATWADVRKNNPDLNLPPDVRQAPGELQAAAEQRFRAQNAKALQAAGIEPTPANLYLAHRAGAQGAQTILNAPPDAPLSTVVPPEWIAQNPDMRTTVGRFVQMAQARFPGQGGNAQQPTPLTIDVRPQPQGIPQGSADQPGMPPAPNPNVVGGPAVIAPPAVPDVPRPQPSPQMIAKARQQIATGQLTPAQAEAAINQELDRDWQAARERAKLQFGQQSEQFKDDRKRANERDNPKFTEDANKAHAYALRVSKALPLLEQMVNSPEGQPSVLDRGVTNLPLVGNMLAGPRGERFDQLSRDLINAMLRRESGAVISEQEFDNARKQYIPQPGDSPETIQLKMENIRSQLKAFADTANRTPDVYGMQGGRGATVAPGAAPAPANGAPQAGAVEGGYRFKGGNPADQRNWERVQ